MRKPFARIAGVGSAAPDFVITNADLEKTLETSDQWIVERTGIRERRKLRDDESQTDLFAAASRDALTRAGVGYSSVDTIICGTCTPARRLPSAACDVQARLGGGTAAAFDVVAACPGWLYSLTVAEGMIASGASRHVLALGGDRVWSIVDQGDRNTAILFGDGAGAAVLVPATDDRGILATSLGAEGTLSDLLYIPAGGSDEPPSTQVVAEKRHLLRMAGREVFKVAVRRMAQACHQALGKAGLRAEDVDLLVPHQANLRIINATAGEAGVPLEKVMVNVQHYGNTSAGSIPLALVQAEREGRLQPGMVVLLVSFGAGFTWGAVLVRW
ncbi:MAG: ketoacyl-ACP synthase III [Gemmatimonadetes bacterium]|nr:ketoacyl-ACP synthase III [Gemmatimonadota bacterium]